jgi:hypothetical protein
MARKINERLKVDVGIPAQAINSTNVTGAYFSLRDYSRIMFVLICGAIAAAKTAVLEALQYDGSAAKGIPSDAAQAAKGTATANAKATSVTITLDEAIATDAVTVNGKTFEFVASNPTGDQVLLGADDTASAKNLADAITEKCPGLKATSALGVVTVVSDDPGSVTIDAASADTTVTIATVSAIAYVEVDASSLDLANGFLTVAPKVTTNDNITCAVFVIRADPRMTPEQAVAAAADV